MSLNPEQKKLADENRQMIELMDYLLQEFVVDDTVSIQQKIEILHVALTQVPRICTTKESETQALELINDILS